MQVFEQDDNVYEFPDDCLVMPDFDELPFFGRLKGADGIHAKGCDILAIRDERTLYLIEAKDYSHKIQGKPRPAASQLATTIVTKSFHTLASLMVGAVKADDAQALHFCRRAVQCDRIVVCATVEPFRDESDSDNAQKLKRQVEEGYIRDLKESLRRKAKWLVKSANDDVMVTSNVNNGTRGKFWTSRWSDRHD